MALTSIEICIGPGGQAFGLERAGFEHRAVVEIDTHTSETLYRSQLGWNVVEQDLGDWNTASAYNQVGNTFLPVAKAAGEQIEKALNCGNVLQVVA